MREKTKCEGAAENADLQQYAAGLVCLTGGDEGPLAAALINGGEEAGREMVERLVRIFGKDSVYIRSGGSIPIVTQFEKDLKIPSIMMGMGLPDDNLHAPNEKFHIPNFYRGIESLIRFFQKLGDGQ